MDTPAPGHLADDRLLTPDGRLGELGPLPLDPASVVAGTPTAGLRELSGSVGIWELGPGTVTDTEVDEVFVVLTGRGSLTFADGSAVDLGPGTVVHLRAGDRTTWVVTETLRKVYVAL